MQFDIFKKKRLSSLLMLAILAAFTYGAMIITQYDVIKGFSSIPKSIHWGLSSFYPTAASLDNLPSILIQLGRTVLTSVAATTVAAVFALFFSLFGSKVTKVNNFLSVLSRGTATVFRNIDVAAWALILLFSFGQSALTGYFALFFVSFGFLTRAFIETLDEVGGHSIEALRATGASYPSIIIQAILPSSTPQMMSWILFMVEMNIRSATLVGILTGTGIGFVFDLYYKSLDYNTASLVVITIVIVILILEYLSNYVRRVVL
ncbi:PhnE/PtxC family ABC transporter permease [Halobacillus halophilus]|uniref:PhnE/PtxC family ABC transporter permease n=1 Tax=Halobacillus halophilus TaxID=1570 RepID=UPI001CD643C1|nr:ABC transporter permease subunit [Halobacillus halophilus]MCA1011966.1 ABC transporter permease subunit [Halobacillus halophilus]